MANAFRKKSFLLQTPTHAFIEEQNTIVESRKQIVEAFINKRESIKPNDRLLKFGDLPILIDGSDAQIAELEKSSKARFEGRNKGGLGGSKATKME